MPASAPPDPLASGLPPDLSTRNPDFDRRDHRDAPDRWTATSAKGTVATAHYLATWAGARILTAGGSAVDAAAAASLALGVVEPAGSGLGGMAMMLVHDGTTGKTVVLPGGCLAPRAATPEAVSRRHRYRGYGAIAVPTLPAVLEHALKHWGRVSEPTVLGPAIELAKRGHPLTHLQAKVMRKYRKSLARRNGAALFLDADGNVPEPGTTMIYPALADTLQQLADRGLSDFYTGDVAREIVADIREGNGFVTLEDLARAVPGPARPLETRFRGAVVKTLGPPGGGLWLAEMLRIWTEVTNVPIDPTTPEGAVLVASVIRFVRRDRRRLRLAGDADDPGHAVEVLTDDYARRAARKIRDELGGADRGSLRRASTGPGETSHVSVIDSDGNAVSMTQSIERSYGSGCASPRLGFLYNGFLRAFKVQKSTHPHYLRPGAVARSNAAPTMAFEDGRVVAALGSTGSERSTSSIFGTLVRLQRESPFGAVAGPRLHATPEGVVLLEAERFPPATLAALEATGFRLDRLDAYSFKTGGVQLAVSRGADVTGVADPRRDGGAAPSDIPKGDATG